MTATLYRGGVVHTRAVPDATALLVEDGVVAWVGAESAVGAGAHDVVELGGAWVAPAFVDAHVHATATGLALGGLDLREARSAGELLHRLEVHSRSSAETVVLGTGWDQTTWPDDRLPTRAELDRAAGGRPVYLARIDEHSALVSPGLLARHGGAPGLQVPAEGPVAGAAHHALRATALAAIDPAQRRSAQRRALAAAAAAGVGCVHECAGPDVSSEADLTDLLALAAAEPGPELVAYWGAAGDVDTPRRLGLRGGAGDVFVDGAVGSHTAALCAAYDDAATTGELHLDGDAVRDHVLACLAADLQPGFHVIGDAALHTVLDALEAVADRAGADRLRRARPRLEHVEMAGPPEIERMARLGVVASVQPAFDALWGGPDGMYAQRLGRDRALAMNPFAALAAAGVPLALGSDCPVTPPDPWGAVRAAVHHRSPRSRLSARAAFAAHTRGGWRAAGVDGAGELVPGAPATFAVWAVDALVVDAPDERVARWSTDARAGVPPLPPVDPDAPPPTCLRTVVRGRTIYDAGALR